MILLSGILSNIRLIGIAAAAAVALYLYGNARLQSARADAAIAREQVAVQRATTLAAQKRAIEENALRVETERDRLQADLDGASKKMGTVHRRIEAGADRPSSRVLQDTARDLDWMRGAK